MNIRTATHQDRKEIERLYSSAFPEGENELVSKLAIDLLSENTTPPTISLIAAIDNAVVGHIAFSPVGIENDETRQAYILAPLAVRPEHQKSRIGSTLIEHGMQQLTASGVDIVFVYGDPAYYGRFGFDAAAALNYKAPYRLQYPFGWQAAVLKEYDTDKTPTGVTCVTSLCDPDLW